ncbi:helix-turn-helix domain-containing protein [Cereibacter sphaeroides]|nr:helix-turn-helix domain-containing protein [Cereibacter sphaeroides]
MNARVQIPERQLTGLSSRKMAASTSVDLLVVPGFSMLALSAFLEPLRLANQEAGHEVFSVSLKSWDGQPVQSANGISVPVQGAVDVDRPSDMTLVCASRRPTENIPSRLPDHIRRLWRRGHIVGGICGGSFALAKAGILAGRRFTLHWDLQPMFIAHWPDLEPSNAVYCREDRIVTCAGGVAAGEMALEMVSECLGGKAAHSIMQKCLIEHTRPGTERQTQSIAAQLGSRNTHLMDAVQWIEQNFSCENAANNLYREAIVSRRQLQRLFRTYLSQSPLQYLRDQRLKRARELLSEAHLTVAQIAPLCGYEKPERLTADFRRRYGLSPRTYSVMSAVACKTCS